VQSLGGSLEELVLTGLVWRPELAALIAGKVTPDLFTTRYYKTIAKAAIDHYMRYSQPAQNHLADILEDELNRGETGQLMWTAISRMQAIQAEMQDDYVLEELNNFIGSRRFEQTLARAYEHLHKGELQKAQETVYMQDPVQDMTPGVWMHDPKLAFRFLDHVEEDESFSLGIQALDSRGIRPKRKTLLVFLAPKKRGKSMALIHAGREAAFVNHQKVLHVTLEMSEDEVAQRYVQSICGWTAGEWHERSLRVPLFKRDSSDNYLGIDFDLLTPQVLSRSTRQAATDKLKEVSRGSRRLLIKEFPTGTLSVGQLTMYLEHLKRAEKFEPDLLLVDYANLMQMNTQQLRLETGRIFRELRGIAMSRNIAIVTATQGNRSSENARIVGSTHVSEDWSIMGTADIVLTICRTPEEMERRLARLYVAAARRVADQYLVMITQNYECCQFATDSIYMNRVAARDFERMIADEDD
jgi:replicative DNA helicase